MKVTKEMINEKQLELGKKPVKFEVELTLEEIDFIRQSLQRFAEFQKEQAIETEKKSYYSDAEKIELIQKRGLATMKAEILSDKIWFNTNLNEDYLRPIRNLENQLED